MQPLTWDHFQHGTINLGPFPTWDHFLSLSFFTRFSFASYQVSKSTLTGAAYLYLEGVPNGIGKEESLLIPAITLPSGGGGGGESGGNMFRVDLLLVFVSTFVVLVLGNMG